MSYGTPREILNKYWWDEKYDFDGLKVTYIHRGAPGNIATFNGEDVDEIKSFLELRRGWQDDKLEIVSLPYHRIIEIEYEGKTVWKRRN